VPDKARFPAGFYAKAGNKGKYPHGIDSDNRDTSNCELIGIIASLLCIANPLDVSVRSSSGSQQIVSVGHVIVVRTQHRRSDIITDMIVGRAC
jgi:hypothetical protein